MPAAAAAAAAAADDDGDACGRTSDKQFCSSTRHINNTLSMFYRLVTAQICSMDGRISRHRLAY